jgi:hypothetical protein
VQEGNPPVVQVAGPCDREQGAGAARGRRRFAAGTAAPRHQQPEHGLTQGEFSAYVAGYEYGSALTQAVRAEQLRQPQLPLAAVATTTRDWADAEGCTLAPTAANSLGGPLRVGHALTHFNYE